jgi:hypothetical protein
MGKGIREFKGSLSIDDEDEDEHKGWPRSARTIT